MNSKTKIIKRKGNRYIYTWEWEWQGEKRVSVRELSPEEAARLLAKEIEKKRLSAEEVRKHFPELMGLIEKRLKLNQKVAEEQQKAIRWLKGQIDKLAGTKPSSETIETSKYEVVEALDVRENRFGTTWLEGFIFIRPAAFPLLSYSEAAKKEKEKVLREMADAGIDNSTWYTPVYEPEEHSGEKEDPNLLLRKLVELKLQKNWKHLTVTFNDTGRRKAEEIKKKLEKEYAGTSVTIKIKTEVSGYIENTIENTQRVDLEKEKNEIPEYPLSP